MKRLSQNSRYFFIVVGVGILILLALGFKTRITALQQLKEEAEAVDAEVTALEATLAALETQVSEATSEVAVEEWAYTEARMKREGDTLIVPISPKKSTPMPVIPVQETTEPMKPWEAWQALFFDSSLP